MRFLILCLCLFYLTAVHAFPKQERDSLIAVLQTGIPANERINILLELLEFSRFESRTETKHYVAEVVALASEMNDTESLLTAKRSWAVMYYQLANYDSARNLIAEILTTPNNADYHKELGMTYKLRGNIYVKQGHTERAISDYRQALELFENGGLVREIAVLNVSLGNYFRTIGNYQASLDHSLKALNLFDSLGEKRPVAIVYNNLGVLFRSKMDYEKAEEYYTKAIDLNNELQNESGLASSYNNLANVYMSQDKLQKSLEYHMLAQRLRERKGDLRGIADSKLNIGEVYLRLSRPEEAIANFKHAHEIYVSIEDNGGISYYLLNMGKAYIQLGKPRNARSYLYDCIEKSREIKYPRNLLHATQMLSELELELENFEQAYHLLHENKVLSDSLLNENNTKEMARLESQYAYEKKEQMLLASQKEAALVYQNSLKEEKVYRYIVIAIATILLIFLTSVFNVYHIIRRKNRALEDTNTELAANKDALEKQKRALSFALDEKNLLMQEIQHRTKNNFLIIQNLLAAQLQNARNENVQYALGSVYHRLESVRLIHEIFYDNDQNFEFVSLRHYMQKLTQRVYDSFCDEHQISLSTCIVDLDIDKDVIIPLGLLTNEVLTNSFKYAFPNNGADCQITLESRYTAGQLTLDITDNGVGFELEKVNDSTMGMRIIEGLSAQLNAKFKFENGCGTRFQLEIPAESLKVREG